LSNYILDYAVGTIGSTHVIAVPTPGVLTTLAHEALPSSISMSLLASEEYQKMLTAVYHDITLKIKGGVPESMGGGRGALHNAMVSLNLVNPAHFDIRDILMSLGTWASNNGKEIGNLVFVLPNVVVLDGGREHHRLVINLSHGTQVAWDGHLIRHCTATPELRTAGALAMHQLHPRCKWPPGQAPPESTEE
jgi:hypothetical protein